MADPVLDCVVIGYNETPFEEYEALLRKYGEDSEAYRDLQFSFVNLGGKRFNYIDLLNYVSRLNHPETHEPEQLKACDIPNLAAAYLTHYLRKHGHQARYINLFQHERDALARYLEMSPLCVAITTTFYVMNYPVREIVRFIRERNRHVQIVVGGPLIGNHFRNYQDEQLTATLEDIGADVYVIESQGEWTLAKLIECLRAGQPLSSVPNIAYWQEGCLTRTPANPESNSLDECAIDWRAFPEEQLGPTLQTRTARSCAFKCSFCNYPTRAGRLVLAGLDTIEHELDSIRELGGVRNIVFIDDTFNVPLARFKDICRLMIRKQYGFNWFSYFRCSNSDEEAIELLARSGGKGVFLGIESGSPRILANMNKAATIEMYDKGIRLLKDYGVLTFASLIVGFPGETEETVDETRRFIAATKPDYYRAQLWYCEAGTPIQQQREKFGISGDGFVWRHATMDSLAAMDHIRRMFLEVQSSVWLPQWSFDFWTIPYIVGKGYSLEQFKELMTWAHKLLTLEIADLPGHMKDRMQHQYLTGLIKSFRQPAVA
jgi:radical SAM PhpK family P-methyltransferase